MIEPGRIARAVLRGSILFEYIKGNRRLIALSVFISLLSAVVKVQTPVVIGYAVDVLISGNESAAAAANYAWVARIAPDLLSACLVVIAIRFGESILRYVSGVMKSIAVEKAGENLRNRLFQRIQYFSFETHGKNHTGELIQRSTADVENYLNFFRSQIDEIIRLGFIVLSSIWIMLNMSASLAVVPLAAVPVVALLSGWFYRKMNRGFERVDKKEAVATGIAQESIAGVRVVRAFGNEQYELERYGAANDNVRDSYFKVGGGFSLYFAVSDFITFAQMGGTLFFGGLMAISGSIGVGTLLAFLMYCEWLSWPLKQLARILMQTGKAFVSARRIGEILNLDIDVEDGTLRPEIRGEIVYDNVSFSYSDTAKGIQGEDDEHFDDENAGVGNSNDAPRNGGKAGSELRSESESGSSSKSGSESGVETGAKSAAGTRTKVLDGISFRIGAGKTLGILGHTGSGKTTLVLLLQRLMEYEGSIKIDGVELRDIEKAWIRENVGLVLQDSYLFSKTVKENINIRNRHQDAEIFRAAEIADIHGNIRSFKSGYDTLVGEKGAQLSGGQKQRIAISRTIIEDKKILIFDDSLSAVDAETDLNIRNSLRANLGNVTSIIISHRVGTVMNADLILVLKDGKIMESGTHDRLKESGGLYQKLWEIQASES